MAAGRRGAHDRRTRRARRRAALRPRRPGGDGGRADGVRALRLVAGGALADWLRAFVDYQLYVNAAILVFNLLPAFPLDGGRVARSLLWRRMGSRERATELAARIGRAFGVGLVVLGLVSFASGGVGGSGSRSSAAS